MPSSATMDSDQKPNRCSSVQTASSDPKKALKNTFHWRHDSGELDVFEAARYFSADHLSRAAGRRSLDAPIMRYSNPITPPDHYHHHHRHHHHHIVAPKQSIKDDAKSKKFKQQPSSPGGRLATFLNSLFSQTPLKKKKKPSKSSAAAAGNHDFEEESSAGRRRRRSSISYFRITAKTTVAAAAEERRTGFRTPPPPHADTPTKSYKELARFAERHAASLPVLDEISSNKDDKFRVSEKINYGEDDDGGESDSSSDLFDLPNDFFCSSLPVYETTHMETIRIAA